MANPFDRLQGITQGRIMPVNFTPQEGDWVYCFGSDLLNDFQLIAGGDFMELSRLDDFELTIIVRFRSRMRGPSQMPEIVEVTSAAVGDYTVTVNGADHDYTAVPADTIDTITFALVDLINTGTQAVEAEQFVNGVLGIIRDDPDDALVVGVTGNLATHTAEWKASIRVDAVERSSAILSPGRTRDRNDMGANVAALAGDHTLAFRLELVSTAPSPIRVELPAFYLDPVIFQLALP